MSSSSREILVTASVAFAVGVLVGYKLKTWRMKFLQKMKEFYDKKASKIQKKIDDEIGVNSTSNTTTTTTVSSSSSQKSNL